VRLLLPSLPLLLLPLLLPVLLTQHCPHLPLVVIAAFFDLLLQLIVPSLCSTPSRRVLIVENCQLASQPGPIVQCLPHLLLLLSGIAVVHYISHQLLEPVHVARRGTPSGLVLVIEFCKAVSQPLRLFAAPIDNATAAPTTSAAVIIASAAIIIASAAIIIASADGADITAAAARCRSWE
jgi:hypothetical protein